MQKPSNILLVKNRALGDSVMGLSSLQYLSTVHSKANIFYAVPQWVAPLYKNTKNPAKAIYPLSLKTIQDTWKLFKFIWRMDIDHIHEMHQSGRGAKIFKLISFVLRIPYTFHNHHENAPKNGVIDQGVIKSLIQRDLDGVYSFLGKGEIPQFLNFPPKLELVTPSKKQPRVIMGVVATRRTKMWPLMNYVALARSIEENFPGIQIAIPLSKSPEDQKIKTELEGLGLPFNAKIVQIGLSDLPKYFSEAVLYIGNDTGLKHIAVAVGLKTFTLFGPEPVNEWHPYDENVHPYFYLNDLSCRTRTHHYCGLAVCDLKEGYMQCLKFFTPEKVMEVILPTCTDFLQSHDRSDPQHQ